MLTILDEQLIAAIIALLIGVVIGFWIFRRTRWAAVTTEAASAMPAEPAPTPPPPPAPAPARLQRDGAEGNTIFDQGAAATGDVTGEVLGLRVHSQLPGAEGPPDDLQMMKGVGPKLAQKLNENGITRFEQLAALTPNEIAILDERMGAFRGRLERDRISEQASYLARGDRDGFQARFGNLAGS